jgi:hypothetical protein
MSLRVKEGDTDIPLFSNLIMHTLIHTLAFFAPYQHAVPQSPEQKCELRDVISTLLPSLFAPAQTASKSCFLLTANAPVA